MARELLCEERIRPTDTTPNDAYARAQNSAIHDIVQRWAGGISCGIEPRVENVHLKTADGDLVGFRLYLVVDEPLVLGPNKVEVVE